MGWHKKTRDEHTVKTYKKILKFIKRKTLKLGYPPSREEIAEHMDVAVNAVNYRLRGMLELGLVDKNPRKQRSLVLTSKGVAYI